MLTFVLGVALCWLLVASVDDPAAAGRALLDVAPLPLALALLAYAASYVCRAIRFAILLGDGRAPLFVTTAIVAVHNLLNMLLPVRSGEVSWVVLAQRHLGARYSEGAATLLLARIYDMIGIAAFFLAAFALHRSETDSDSTRWLLGAGGLLGLSLLALALLEPGIRFVLRRIPETTGESSLRAKARRVLDSLASAVVESKRNGTFLRLFIVTEAQWLCTFLTCFALLRACPGTEDVGFAASIVGSTGLSLALILPINPVGNVGTFQAGWIGGHLLAGVDRQTATASALVAHAAILLFAALLGGIGHALLSRRPEESARGDPSCDGSPRRGD